VSGAEGTRWRVPKASPALPGKDLGEVPKPEYGHFMRTSCEAFRDGTLMLEKK